MNGRFEHKIDIEERIEKRIEDSPKWLKEYYYSMANNTAATKRKYLVEENKMTGRELSDKLNYLGMERRIRKLALEEKLETAEKIAVMTEVEVCELISKKYEVVYSEAEEIGLVRKDKMKEYNYLVKVISR